MNCLTFYCLQYFADCLALTAAALFFVQMVSKQLAVLGYADNAQLIGRVTEPLKSVWQSTGDLISRMYAGTGALEGKDTVRFICFCSLLFFFIFYLPYLFSIHEKAMYRYVLDGESALAWELPFPAHPPVFHMKVGRLVTCFAQGHKRTCRLVLHNLP